MSTNELTRVYFNGLNNCARWTWFVRHPRPIEWKTQHLFDVTDMNGALEPSITILQRRYVNKRILVISWMNVFVNKLGFVHFIKCDNHFDVTDAINTYYRNSVGTTQTFPTHHKWTCTFIYHYYKSQPTSRRKHFEFGTKSVYRIISQNIERTTTKLCEFSKIKKNLRLHPVPFENETKLNFSWWIPTEWNLHFLVYVRKLFLRIARFIRS